MKALGMIQRRPVRTGVLFVFFALVGIQVYLLFSSPENHARFDDFKIYYDAGNQALSHQSVYNEYPEWPGKIKFKYSPLIALIFGVTVSQIPYETSKWVFYWVSLLSWLSLMGYLAREALLDTQTKTSGTLPSLNSRILVLMGLFLAFYCNALRNDINLGQTNWIPIGLLLIFFFSRRHASKKLWLTAATLLSIAIQFKLYCVVALYYLLLRRRFGLILGVLGITLLTGLVLPSFFQGWSFSLNENLRWLISLSSSSRELLVGYENVSVLGVLSKKLGVGPLSQGLWVLCAALGFGFLLLKPLKPRHAFSYLLLMIVLFNPLAWPYWILFTAPAFLWITATLLNDPRRPKLRWILAAGVLLLLTNTIDRAAPREGGIVIATLMLACAFHLKTPSVGRTGQLPV